jgi:hypothetical protein
MGELVFWSLFLAVYIGFALALAKALLRAIFCVVSRAALKQPAKLSFAEERKKRRVPPGPKSCV